MNTVKIVQNEHCTVKVYNTYPKSNSTLYIFIESVDDGYTFKSLSVSVPTYTTVTYTNNGSRYTVNDIPGILYRIAHPMQYDNKEITITVELYTNPIIQYVNYANPYSVISHTFIDSTPNIYSKTGFSKINMVNGWKFLKYELREVSNPDVVYETVTTYNGEELNISPSYADKKLFIRIYNDPSAIPCLFQYYLFDETDNTYRKKYEDIIYKTPEDVGTFFDYIPKSMEGYRTSSNIIRNVKVYEEGTAIPIEFDPVTYSIIAMYGNVVSSSENGAKYTENVTVSFDWTKYDGNPNDIFVGWMTEEGFNIPDNQNETVTFKMPAINLKLYPFIKPYRQNSNLYRNIECKEVKDADYIYTAFRENIRCSGDIRQVNHGFTVGDVVYYDNVDKRYKKALADGTNKSLAIGMVKVVNSVNIFCLQWGGPMNVNIQWPYDESSIMYLSDTEPGKLKYYSDIHNRVYIPIAVYTHDNIIVCMHEGTVGMEYQHYPDKTDEENGAGPYIEKYSSSEINNIKNDIIALYTA